MKTKQNTEIGAQGEKIAQQYLKGVGFCILQTNWRFRHKEIDIIAKKDNVIHIVEVKTRTSHIAGNPQDAVTKQKQKFLIYAANAYVETIDFEGGIQFDIISVIIQNNTSKLQYIPDAFYPQL